MAKSKKLSSNNNTTEESKFLTFDAKTAYNLLQKAFTKVLILQHFDPEYHIQIKINASGYTIDSVLSQLIFDADFWLNSF